MDSETSVHDCYESESGNITEETEQDPPQRRTKQQTDDAVKLITSSKVSTSKAPFARTYQKEVWSYRRSRSLSISCIQGNVPKSTRGLELFV